MRPKNENKAWKSTNFTLILYTETESYDIESVLTTLHNLDDVRYCYILHDRDVKPDGELKKPHYHVNIHFDNAHYNTAVSDLLGVPINYIQRIKSWKHAAQYLIHQNNPEKYQYESDLVTANYPFNSDLSADADELSQARALYTFLRDTNCCSFDLLLDYALSNGLYSALRRGSSLFNNIIRENREIRKSEVREWQADSSHRNWDRSNLDLRSPSLSQLDISELEALDNEQMLALKKALNEIKKQKPKYDADRSKLHDGVMCDPGKH